MSTLLSVTTPVSPLLVPNLDFSRPVLDSIANALHTLFLFTYTDFKTIVFPVTAFACVAAPIQHPKGLLDALAWIWLHLLQCNVSNQYKSVSEDVVNRPWRPLPSGRISANAARWLRWSLIPICLAVSARHGKEVVLASATLTVTTLLYDEAGLAGHFIGKNLCAVPGYVTFEVGATRILAAHALDDVARMSLLCSALVISTTIHVQDFPDVAGDQALGRVTIPIWAPSGSRLFTLFAIPAWTVLLCRVWGVGIVHSALLGAMGAGLGHRIYARRHREEDKVSYLLYNLWLLTIHILPAHARWGICQW